MGGLCHALEILTNPLQTDIGLHHGLRADPRWLPLRLRAEAACRFVAVKPELVVTQGVLMVTINSPVANLLPQWLLDNKIYPIQGTYYAGSNQIGGAFRPEHAEQVLGFLRTHFPEYEL